MWITGSQTTISTIDRIKASRDTEKNRTTAKLIDCAKTGKGNLLDA
jgi:hypothetical protein